MEEKYFQLVERRLNFHSEHLGGGNYTALYATTEPQTDSDQESYVQQCQVLQKDTTSKQTTHMMKWSGPTKTIKEVDPKNGTFPSTP